MRRGADDNLPQHIARELRQRIDRGEFRPGERLPSTRRQAASLGVARGTVVAAYELLRAEGYVSAVQGRGTLVRPDLAQAVGTGEVPGTPWSQFRPAAPLDEHTPQPLPLTPGVPLTDVTTRAAWRRAWRLAREAEVSRIPAEGLPELRNAISAFLRASRTVGVDPRVLLITAGAREGLALILLALRDQLGRAPVIGVEQPGYPSLRRVVSRLGAASVGVPVDREGVDHARVPGGLDALLLTPSHQYPAGGTLPLGRRAALVEWARSHGVLLIEDDFDAALRFRGTPLPPLHAFEEHLHDPQYPGSVVTLGSFAAQVPSSTNTGYVMVPRPLRDTVIDIRRDLGNPVPAMTQVALTELLRTGEMDLLLPRQRARLIKRYRTLAGALSGLPHVTLQAQQGGINAVVRLQRGLRAEHLIPTLRNALLGPVAESHYWHLDEAAASAGIDHGSRLIVGLGGADAEVFAQASIRFANALDDSA